MEAETKKRTLAGRLWGPAIVACVPVALTMMVEANNGPLVVTPAKVGFWLLTWITFTALGVAIRRRWEH